ncbi:MAG: T9SS type A sorting domain-containing protein [Phycisphaerales bacterium]|nr:T9SS type A sorting domain-containing protein [Phycisphaerales bacterium]
MFSIRTSRHWHIARGRVGLFGTVSVLKESVKGMSGLGYWAVANWSAKGGVPVGSGDISFPIAAAIKLNNGSAFAASSFTMLKGIFRTDTFVSPISAINSSNIVSSTYKTYKDSALTSRNAHFVASIDADTFRVTVLVWSKDTLPSKGAIHEQSRTQVLVYPNPATDLLQIQAVEIGSSIALFDISGKLVKQEEVHTNNMSIDIKDLASGLYQLRITCKDGRTGTAQVKKE